jgi:flagellar FliL protein
MAQETPTAHDASTAEADPTAAPGKPALPGKIKVVLFVLAVIALECVVAYLYLPSAAETAALAGATLGANPKADTPAEQDPHKEQEAEKADQVEVDLGQFSVTAFQPASNSTLRIDFRLYGTVSPKEEKEFLRLKEENLHRFRDQVIVTVRSADIADLTDAGLGVVKRKILEKTNRIFGKPLLKTVIFSDFASIEQ